MGCLTRSCRSSTAEPNGDKTSTGRVGQPRWRRARRWLLVGAVVTALGLGIGYYILFVPSAEYVAQKKKLEERQTELDRAFGPAPSLDEHGTTTDAKEKNQ